MECIGEDPWLYKHTTNNDSKFEFLKMNKQLKVLYWNLGMVTTSLQRGHFALFLAFLKPLTVDTDAAEQAHLKQNMCPHLRATGSYTVSCSKKNRTEKLKKVKEKQLPNSTIAKKAYQADGAGSINFQPQWVMQDAWQSWLTTLQVTNASRTYLWKRYARLVQF